ncbi:AraC family transcriptional regulator [Dysgonomonas alginatilytica]|uniref:AraC family transcriptional regulator n=1 Tax=Dysgonomonas alginatilytica TaxID=1605892 RepID=A0A2V3PHJ2_9BACT|nr:AraC family transcriptional regulator [Dysgonomonas alginatilytica]PXV58438.1 AraC family transcriptional regulator [Dysgonomonas alginatilytica]
MQELKDTSRQEYLARINKVLHYIDNHLDISLSLEKVAEVASFSPFHFHRIFTFFIGETPCDYIQRLRIEKAAWKLRNETLQTITEIAYTCGFGSVSLLSRTFRKYFNMTPTQFRETEQPVFSFDGKLFSKNGQMLRKNLKSDTDLIDDLCIDNSNKLFFMQTKVEVKEMPEMKAVYCRHVGPFHLIGQAYEKLSKWATPRGLFITNVSKTATVTHDDPSITEIEKVRQSACLIVEREVEVDGEIGKMTIPRGKYAVGRFEITNEEFQQAWNTMCLWFTESGYQQGDGCTYELYHNDFTTHPEKRHIVDICIPVKPL